MSFHSIKRPAFIRIPLGYVCIILVGIGSVITNFFQFFSLFWLPFSGSLYRRHNRIVVSVWWAFFAFCLEKIVGIKVHLSGSKLPDNENAIVVTNHQSWSDVPLMAIVAQNTHRVGDLKWFIKDILKYLPGIGWGNLFMESLFIKRNWHADRKFIFAMFSRFSKYKIPLWLMCFAEGTRKTPEKHRRSMDYARRKGFAPTRHVMIPRTKGFVASVQGLRNYVTAVYDVTIGYVGFAPDIIQLFQRSHPDVYINVKRYPMAEIPEDEESLSQWLVDRFREKDELLDHFCENGKLD